jgi:hypothetical protein
MDFLKRPVSLARINWQTGFPEQTFLQRIKFPQEIWTQRVWNQKLANFRYLKASLVFRFLINGSQFDIGRLWCFWSPYTVERNRLGPWLSRSNTTAYPGVELDIGNQNDAQLKIPYVSYLNHIDQLGSDQPYGDLIFQILFPLESVTAGAFADIDVQCWLEDIDLTIPTDTTGFVGQSGEGMSKSIKDVVVGGSQVVGAVAKVAKHIPIVKEIAEPLQWVSDAVKGASSLLGFSKPNDMKSLNTFENIPGKGFTQTDGLNDTIMLAMKQDNSIEVDHSVFGTEADEMDINYVVSRDIFFQDFDWTISNNHGDMLFRVPVHAGINGTDTWLDQGASTEVFMTTTLMSYVASLFQYWSGSVNFRFSIVKNRYYSGRLIFCFFPGVLPADISSITSKDINTVSRWYYDVKETSDLKLNIPYQSATDWLRVALHNNRNATSRNRLTLDNIVGTLACFVDNPLRAPTTTVPGVINVQVWVSGGEDMTFAVPTSNRYFPYSPTTRNFVIDILPDASDPAIVPWTPPVFNALGVDEEVIEEEVSEEPVFVAQSGNFSGETTFDVLHHDITDPREGATLLSAKEHDKLTPCKRTIGESIISLCPLTRRISFVTQIANDNSGTPITAFDPAFMFEVVGGDIWNYMNSLAFIYAFYRGSVNYKVFFEQIPLTTAASPSNVLLKKVQSYAIVTVGRPSSGSPIPLNTTAPMSSVPLGAQAVHNQNLKLNPVVSFSIPFYSNVPILPISPVWPTNRHFRVRGFIRPVPAPNVNNNVIYDIYRGGGDDFRMGFLVGSPAIFDSEGT